MRRDLPIVFVVAIVAHISALSCGFVWLDHAHIEDGLALAQHSSVSDIFTHGFAGTGFYRPVMSLSLSLDALIGGGPHVFHATNLLCHALAAVMTTLAAEALGASRRAALFAGILFAAHPLSGIVANAIAFRSEALIAIALLGLIWAHVRKRPLVAAAAIIFGGLTKETALALAPLFIVSLELLRSKKKERSRALLGVEATAFAVVLGLRQLFAPTWRATAPSLDFGDAMGTRFASIAKSTATIVIPFDHSVCDAFVITRWWKPQSLAGLVVIAAIIALAWWHHSTKRGPAALLLACAIVPALQLVPVQRWWSPHYLYIPLAFVAMLVARVIDQRKPIFYGAITAAIALATLSIFDGFNYRDDTSLWTREVVKQPACREGHFYLGDVDRRARRWDEAARHFESAIASRPNVLAYVDQSAALQNLGAVRLEQHRYADARKAFRAALDGTTDARSRREITHNLAATALSEGDPAAAAALLEEETSRPDALPESIALRAEALRQLHR